MKFRLVVIVLALGGAVMAQSGFRAQSLTGTGSLTLAVSNSGQVSCTFTGSWSGTIQPKVQVGTATAANTTVYPAGSTTSQGTITANGTYTTGVSGYDNFILTGGTVTGTATVSCNRVQQVARISSSGGGGGSGTVTEVDTTSPLSGGPITTTGSIACTTCTTNAAGLTSTAIMTGGGSQASQTPSATATLNSSGNMSLPGTLGVTGHLTFEGVTSTGATGTGKLVFDASPTITGHPTVEGVTSTGATGTGKFVFDASPTITGHETIEGVTATGATGTGRFVFDNSPTLITPVLGVATATTVNNVTLTAPASAATLTIANNKTLTASNTMTLAAGADSQTFTFPAVSDTVAGLGTAQTFSAQNHMTGNFFQVCGSSQTNCSSGTWTSTAANTLENISGLSFVLAANTAQVVPFTCRISYKQNSAAAPIQWGMQSSLGTNGIQAGANWNTTGGTQSTFELTTPITAAATPTAISASGTPGDTTAVRIAILSGTIDNPSQAANTINMMVLTQTQADTVSVRNLSHCTIGFN